MRRISIKKEDREGDSFRLNNEQLHHLKVAKRFSRLLCCWEGIYYECNLEGRYAKIIKQTEINNEYQKPLYLAIAYIKLKNIELVIQKAIELGVKGIYLFVSQYTEKKNVFELEKKIDRFEKIVVAAAEQSFRNIIPAIESVGSFKDLIELGKNLNKFIAYEGERGEGAVETLPTNSIIVIGPEGGFSAEEIEIAKEKGFISFSLGKRILRSETAAIAALAKIKED